MTAKKAIIYCRVSNVKQTTRGDGLNSQETRCRDYARYKGYEVVLVFKDDVSGSLVARPGMDAMLAFLRKHRKTDPHVVIIDDVSRLARGIQAHWQLRAKIANAGGILESPSIEFGDDADSEMHENMIAVFAQHHRRKNAEQTLNRMRSRVLNGYWTFWAPRGFTFQATRSEGKVLVRDEPLASVVQEALEGFASGRFAAQVEVKRFLEAHPAFPKDLPNGEIRQQRVVDMLKQPLYAGYLEVPSWSIPLRKARHEGLISFETFQRIQHLLREGARTPARADLSADFPLRGHVTCGDCGNPLTACWSKGKQGIKYPYYLCYSKGCSSYRKSIARERIEGAFEALLKALQPSDALVGLARSVFEDLWNDRLASTADIARGLKADLATIEKQTTQLLDRIVEASTPSVIAAYEKRIAKLEEDKLVIEEKLRDGVGPRYTFAESFEPAVEFLLKPWKLWDSGVLDHRRTVLKLVFADRLPFCRNRGFRTPKTTLPFNVLAAISAGKEGVARPGRFELPTS